MGTALLTPCMAHVGGTRSMSLCTTGELSGTVQA